MIIFSFVPYFQSNIVLYLRLFFYNKNYVLHLNEQFGTCSIFKLDLVRTFRKF